MSEPLIKTPSVFGDNANFLLERELGTGGMGGVYLGRDKMLDRPVAVKIMLRELGADAEFLEKFRREAQSVARLTHPNIVQVYSYGVSDGMPYMAMELAAGGSLFSLMNANPGKTDIQRVLKICQQTALALQCASDQGIIHGDVKPENILLDANGNAKLVDFGLAAMQKDTTEIWGTPYYISPEKVRKDAVDFRADMYSLGGTLYHALTGVAPFEGEDSVAVVKKRFVSMPKNPSEIRPEISPAVDNLVMTMLAMEKENRYPSFEALLLAFKEVLTTGLTQRIEKPDNLSRPRKKGGRPVVLRKSTARKAVTAAVPERLHPQETDEDESGGNLGLKVALCVVGGLLAIGAIVGCLVWFKYAHEKSERESHLSQVRANSAQAKDAIQSLRESTQKFAEQYVAESASVTSECLRVTVEFSKIMPAFVQQLIPAVSNTLAKAESEGEKLPDEVIQLYDLWKRAYQCQAAGERIAVSAQKILAECDKAATFDANTDDGMKALGELSLGVKALYDKMADSSKDGDASKVHSGLSYVKSRGATILKNLADRLRREENEAKRKEDERLRELAEKKRAEELAEARKQLIEQETTEIATTFEKIAAQGCFRQLDWDSAYRQLKSVSETFKTAEGELAAKSQIKKVDQMKMVQDLFIARLKGYVFRGKLKGAKVVAVNANDIHLLQDEKKLRISWQKFYRDYPGNFNEIINNFIVNGRKNGELKNLQEWSDAMIGAALTLRLVCAEVDHATEKAESMVRDVVKQFPDIAASLHETFPDIAFDSVPED